MPKLKLYPLKDYIKGAEVLASTENRRLEVHYGKGSAVRFEIFNGDEKIPSEFWVVHINHTKKKEIWSRDNYKKPDHCFGVEPGTFIRILENL
jgi:hypothetical protein